MLNAASLVQQTENALAKPAPKPWSNETVVTYIETVTKFRDLFLTFLEKEKAIQANVHLSDDGKRKEILAAAVQVIQRLKWLASVIATLEQSRAHLHRTLVALPVTHPDPTLSFLMEQEIRNRHATLNPIQRGLAYTKASEIGELSICAALTNSPGGSWVSGEVRDRADTERGKWLHAAQHQQDVQAGYLLEHVASLREGACVWALTLNVAQSVILGVFGPTMTTGMEVAKPVMARTDRGEAFRSLLAEAS